VDPSSDAIGLPWSLVCGGPWLNPPIRCETPSRIGQRARMRVTPCPRGHQPRSARALHGLAARTDGSAACSPPTGARREMSRVEVAKGWQDWPAWVGARLRDAAQGAVHRRWRELVGRREAPGTVLESCGERASTGGSPRRFAGAPKWIAAGVSPRWAAARLGSEGGDRRGDRRGTGVRLADDPFV
jgi:hypothetical protein